MIGLIIYLCIVSVVLLLGMFGGSNMEDRRGFMYAFSTCILVIAAIAIKSM